MDKVTMTELIISTKLEKKLTWEKIGTDLGLSPVWLTSACLGMNSARINCAHDDITIWQLAQKLHGNVTRIMCTEIKSPSALLISI